MVSSGGGGGRRRGGSSSNTHRHRHTGAGTCKFAYTDELAGHPRGFRSANVSSTDSVQACSITSFCCCCCCCCCKAECWEHKKCKNIMHTCNRLSARTSRTHASVLLDCLLGVLADAIALAQQHANAELRAVNTEIPKHRALPSAHVHTCVRTSRIHGRRSSYCKLPASAALRSHSLASFVFFCRPSCPRISAAPSVYCALWSPSAACRAHVCTRAVITLVLVSVEYPRAPHKFASHCMYTHGQQAVHLDSCFGHSRGVVNFRLLRNFHRDKDKIEWNDCF